MTLQLRKQRYLPIPLLFLMLCVPCFAAGEPARPVVNPDGSSTDASDATSLDRALGSGVDGEASPQTPTAASVPAAPAPAQRRGFFTRLGHAYLDDWTVD